MTDRNVERELMISIVANRRGRRYLYRGVEQWQLVRLITWRSVVRSHPPQHNGRLFDNDVRQSFFIPSAPILSFLYHPLLYALYCTTRSYTPTPIQHPPRIEQKIPPRKFPDKLGWFLGDSWVIVGWLQYLCRIHTEFLPTPHRKSTDTIIGDS